MKIANKLIKKKHPLRKTPLYQAFPWVGQMSWDYFKQFEKEVHTDDDSEDGDQNQNLQMTPQISLSRIDSSSQVNQNRLERNSSLVTDSGLLDSQEQIQLHRSEQFLIEDEDNELCVDKKLKRSGDSKRDKLSAYLKSSTMREVKRKNRKALLELSKEQLIAKERL